MSFGLPSRNLKIEAAVKEAYDANKILFAAASNGGGNAGRTFPAKDDRVICIYATDGRGNKYFGNPSPEERAYNFSILGVNIPCFWKDCEITRSGTSYATPIAAGIAATILDYARSKRSELTDEQLNQLSDGAGMRCLFIKMSRLRDGYDYIAPWNTVGATSEGYIRRQIMNALDA